MDDGPMDRLRQVVLSDPSLWPGLLEIADRQEFIMRLAALARDHQVPIDGVDIDEELAAARCLWRQRWI
jgi:hypothetical protein